MKIISWIFWVTQLFLRLREFEALLLFDCAKLPEQLPEFLLIALPAGPAGTRLWSQPSQITKIGQPHEPVFTLQPIQGLAHGCP